MYCPLSSGWKKEVVRTHPKLGTERERERRWISYLDVQIDRTSVLALVVLCPTGVLSPVLLEEERDGMDTPEPGDGE